MLRALRRERGQDLVEFALVLPIVLALLFAIVELALIIFAYNTISDAARQGARWAVIGVRATDIAGIQNAAYEVTDPALLDRLKLHVIPSQPTTDTVRVDVTYDMDLFFSIGGSSKITLHAVSTKRIETE